MSSRTKYLLALLVLLSSNLIYIQSANAALYSFTSHTFTNCSATGASGPTQAACRSAYTTTWDENNSYYTVTSGIQYWTVPATGTYTITAVGAGGASPGGKPASMTGDFLLTEGTIIKILVGQLGTTGYGRGGGGGTFVSDSSNSPLIVGGGGGGGNYNSAYTGGNASIVANPASSAGDATAASSSGGCGMNGGGGAGFSSDGSSGAKSFLNGGSGGSTQPGNCVTNAPGGFGGGGGGGNGGGGGGGYFGGAPGANVNPYPAGSGGGSYNSGSNQTNVLAVNSTSHGSVTIVAAAPDTTPPTFISSTNFSTPENVATTVNVATIQVSESATITISSGADAALFNIIKSDSVTSQIRFKSSPNYEAPIDVGANNVYDLIITATDSAGNSANQSITITVTDVLDTSSFNSFSLAGGVTVATFRQPIQINASVTVASRITFREANVVIAGCKSILATGSGSTFTVSCSWKPSKRGGVTISASSTPTNVAISGATANPQYVSVLNRTAPK